MTRNAKDAAIAARHADIPQDSLFDVADGDGGTVETQRPSRAIKAAAWGVCPECFTIEATAQILDGDRLVWREHHRTAGRQRLRCRASGTTQSIGEGNSGTREQAQHAATRRVGAGA